MSVFVLVVDDEPSVLKLLQTILMQGGYTVKTANSVEGAKPILEQYPIALLITDLQMPEVSGLELIGFVRQHHPEIGIIVATILDKPADAQRVIDAGVYGYIIKPFNKNLVLITVANTLRRRELELQQINSRKSIESQLEIIMNSLHVGLLLVDDQAGIIALNRQLSVWFDGVSKGDSLAQLDQFYVPYESEQSLQLFTEQALRTGEGYHFLAHFLSKQGELDMQVSLLVVKLGDQSKRAVVLMLEDITEQLNKERELRQAQKLEAIGQLAAGITHEINTPIQYLGDNIRFLGEALEELFGFIHSSLLLVDGENSNEVTRSLQKKFEELKQDSDLEYLQQELPQTLVQCLSGISRISSIIKAMREFSHPGTESKIDTDVNQCLESTVIISRNEWKYASDLTTQFQEDLPLISALPGELNQVFLNILINASHAISSRIHEGGIQRGCIHITTQKAGDGVLITIADNGGGIPQEIQERVYTPFFTTKEIGKGTGQGLAIAKNIVVEKHGGEISFETEEGEGTTFFIRLPMEYSK
nr:response regulator [uncultured Desulfobulbus sp.]